MGEMINARDAMARAIDCAERGDVELGKLWLGIARELRAGSRPAPSSGDVAPDAPAAVRFPATQVPAPRPFERDGSAVQQLDYGQRYEDEPTIVRAEHVMQAELDTERAKAKLDETVVASDAFGAEGLQQVARVLRSMDDHPQRWVTGDIESDEQRLRRTPRPFIETNEAPRFDAFAAGRASVERRLEETGILSAGDPTRCRHCDAEIYEADLSEVSTPYRYRHKLSGQAICTTPPKGMSEQGDESYVTGSHTMAEPGGMPYRP
jgi:hypothetical protein